MRAAFQVRILCGWWKLLCLSNEIVIDVSDTFLFLTSLGLETFYGEPLSEFVSVSTINNNLTSACVTQYESNSQLSVLGFNIFQHYWRYVQTERQNSF